MRKRNIAKFLRLSLLLVLIAGMTLQPQFSVRAVPVMSIEPITWNVIGLDSNNVSVGPNHFPVGARVCNTSTAGETLTNVKSAFVFDDGANPYTGNAYINLRAGTLSAYTANGINLSPGACTDFYYEVAVTRTASAYNQTRNYHITATSDQGASGSTPTPRTLIVEYLVSQNRNAVTDVQYGTSIASLSSVAPGGTMTMMVGNTYYIRLIGYTATQGYEQLESFINIPNTIFQVSSVTTTYTADSSATVSSPNDKAYGNACVWENDPASPNYRSCLSTGKVGGNITVTYQVKILQVPAAPLVNPAPLSTLIYDFSGSSFHYNADYGVSTRFANIVNASIIKSFSPKTVNPGDPSTLTFTVKNPGPAVLGGVNFADNLPSGLTISSTTVTYNGCGTPSPASLTVGATSVSFSNITVAGLGTCTVAVNVSAAADGTYNNTSNNLFINTSQDTGSFATDTLLVSSKPPAPSTCATPTTLATWTMPAAGQGSGGPPPPFTFKAANVATATASSSGGTSSIVAGAATNAWQIQGGWELIQSAPTSTTTPYFQFTLDTSNYGGVSINFDYLLSDNGDWAAAGNNFIYIHTQANSGSFSTLTPVTAAKGSWTALGTARTASSTGVGTTTFRINVLGAPSNKPDAKVTLDNIVITGCPRPIVPTLGKSFLTSPIPQVGTSTLQFTFTNPNGSALTGVGFTDTLPLGLVVATPNGLTTSCTTGTFTGATTTAVSGTRSVGVSGGTLSANANCTISVNVLGSAAGQYTNVSSPITSTETGPNTTGTGFGTSSLTVIAPPSINKSFTANPIFTGNTTALSFSITNPNAATALTGISFTDTLPAGLTVATSSSSQCGGTLTTTAATGVVVLTGGSLAAGAGCSFSVTVTGAATGLKTNSVTVSSTNGGTGNTSTANVLVKDPAPAINLLKQVGPSASGPWTSFLTAAVGSDVYYRFTVENTGDVTLTNVSVSDPTVSTAGCSWTRGDSAAPVTSPFTLPIADADNNQIATCVLGPFAAVSGSNTNTATASGTSGSTVTKSSSATYGTPELTLDKSATQTSFSSAGDTLNYSYLVTNSGFAPLPGPVTVSDDKTTVTCPAVTTVGDNDNYLDPSESVTCTATYTVTAADVTAGFVTNTASASAGGVASNTDSVTVNQARPDLTVTKANNVSGTLAQNGTFNWTITVTNSGTATASFADTNVILSDPLPGAVGYYPQGALTVTNGATPPTGAINCSITGTALSCAASGAVTLPAGASFSITFAVTPTAAGSLANTATVDPNNNITEGNESNNTGSDTLTVLAPPSISKSFGAATINLGGTTTLSFTITNPNTATALTGVAFTDVLPAGLTVADGNSSVCGGTNNLTTTAATGTITLTGGTIAASGNCTFNVTVTGATAGAKNNTTGNVTSTNGGTGNTASASTTVLAPDLTVAKTNNVSGTVPQNGTFNWTITVTNSGTGTASFAATNVILSDPLPGVDGYYPQGSLTVTNGATAPIGTINCSISGTALGCAASGAVTMPAGASFSVTFAVTPTAAGSLANNATADPNNNVTEGNEGNNSGSDTVTVLAPPSISKSFSPNPVAAGTSSTLTFTVTNSNSVALTGVAFTDVLPVGLNVADGTSNACGGTNNLTTTAATRTIAMTGGTIAATGNCTITVTVVPATGGNFVNVTGNVTSTNGGTGNTASSTLIVFDAQPAKSLVSTSEPFTGLVGGTQRVAVGEMVRYRLAARIPEGTFTNVQLLDGIPSGLQFLNDGTATVGFVCNGGAACMTSSTLSGAGLIVTGSSSAVSPTFVLPGTAISGGPFVSGTDVTFSFGDVTNSDADADSEYIVVEFNALVLNVNTAATINQGLDNQPGANGVSNINNRQNDVTLRVNGANVGSASPNVTVAIAEPSITSVTKSVSPATGPYLPGSVLTYSLTFNNNGTGSNATTAFDIVLTDTFDSNLTLGTVNVSSTQGATCAGSNTFTTNNSTVGQLVTVNVSCLDPGSSVTVTVNATISASASSGTTIANTSGLTYTSLPGTQGNCAAAPFTCSGVGASGSGTGERNGSGGPGTDGAVVNNFAVTSNTTNTTVAFASITITKDAVPENAQDFAFTGSGPGGYTFGGGFSLDDDADGNLPNTLTFTPLPTGSYTVVEGTVSGWTLTGLTCTDPDSGSTTDIGTATATIDLDAGENVSCTFTNTLQQPSIVLTKTAAPTAVTAVGDVVTYSFSVQNTGNVTLTNVTLSDSLLSGLNCTAIASLAPNTTQSFTCTGNTYTVTQTDIDNNGGGDGDIDNTATATGTTPSGGTTSDTDSQTVTLPALTPGLTLTKTAAPTTVTAVGDVVTYSFSVQNTGNVTLTNISLSDSLLSGLNCTAIASLAPNAIQSFTCTGNTYTVTQTDIDNNGGGDGDIDNTATATGTTPGGGTTSDTSSQAVTLPAQAPLINIVKSPATQNIISGGTANFTLTVTNTGNVTLTGVTVTDAQCTTGPTFTGGDTNNDNQLQLSETWTYSCSVANVTANFTNTASVTTTQGVTDTATANVTVSAQQVDLGLAKSVSNTSPLVATNITFTLTVTNADPIPATSVVVTDILPAGFTHVSDNGGGAYNSGTGVWTVGTVPANGSVSLTITVSVNVTGPYTNYAEITGMDQVDPDSTPNNGSTDEDDDDSVTVTPSQNNPSLGKSVSNTNQAFTTGPNVAIGEIVEYTVTVNVPPGVFSNSQLVDTMERGLSFMTCSSVTPSDPALTTDVAGSFSSVCSSPAVDDAGGGTTVDVGRRVTFDLGTVTNASGTDQTLTFVYTTVVLDSAGNVSGTGLDNSAVWVSDSGSQPPAVASLLVAEPDLSITKTANTSLVSVGSEITLTLTIQHTADSNVNAYDAAVTDTLPVEMELVPGSLECVSGAQNANTCTYNAGTRTIDAVWNTFTRAGGDGRVTFRVRVVSLPSGGISNVANVAWSSLPGDISAPQNGNVFSTERDYDPASLIDVYGASDTLVIGVFGSAPATGFAPNVVTELGDFQAETYAQTGGLLVEIPSLGVKIPVVGVPLRNGEWNVSWLGNQAGWLEGSAFPSWGGNSVLTGHVYGANGLPGPFVNLGLLRYGDRLLIHAYGRIYTYEVRAKSVVEPNDASIFRHEEKSWLTLVTCKEFDEKTNSYRKRVVVKAVLVNVSGK